MTPLIPLSDKLIAAIVPEDASRIRLLDHTPEYDRQSIIYFAKGKLVGADLMFLPSGKWEIVKEITNENVDEPIFIDGNYWADLITLLASHDIYWVNPDQYPKYEDYEYYDAKGIDGVEVDTIDEKAYNESLAKWQRKQSNADEMKGNKIIILAKID